jgi:hypothetical protein
MEISGEMSVKSAAPSMLGLILNDDILSEVADWTWISVSVEGSGAEEGSVLANASHCFSAPSM